MDWFESTQYVPKRDPSGVNFSSIYLYSNRIVATLICSFGEISDMTASVREAILLSTAQLREIRYE